MTNRQDLKEKIDNFPDIGKMVWWNPREKDQKKLDRCLAEAELLDLCDWEGGMFYSINYYGSDNSFDWLVGNGSIFSPYRFKSVESVKKAIETLGTEKLKLIFRID